MAKDSAFILLRLGRNSPGLTVRETTLKDGDFPLRPSQSYKLKRFIFCQNNFPLFCFLVFVFGLFELETVWINYIEAFPENFR